MIYYFLLSVVFRPLFPLREIGGQRYFIGLVQSVVLKSGNRGHISPIIELKMSIVYCSLW